MCDRKFVFHFRHSSGDAYHRKTLSKDLYRTARAESIQQLVDVGVDSRAIIHHKAKWTLVKVGSQPYRAILISVERAVLDIDKVTKMMRSRLELVSHCGSGA